MDKKLIYSKFAKSLDSYNNNAIAQKKICDHLITMLKQCEIDCFDRVIEIGCGTGLLSSKIINAFTINHIIFNDLIKETQLYIEKIMTNHDNINWHFSSGDAEEISFPNNIDLCISASTFHWFNDIKAFFHKVHQSLRPNGLFAFNTFGIQNLLEIKQIMGNGLNYNNTDFLKSVLQTNFDILTFKEELIAVSFQEPLDVLKHIKRTGVNGIQTEVWGKTKLNHFIQQYISFSGKNGGVTLTYHPIYFILRKKEQNGFKNLLY